MNFKITNKLHLTQFKSQTLISRVESSSNNTLLDPLVSITHLCKFIHHQSDLAGLVPAIRSSHFLIKLVNLASPGAREEPNSNAALAV